MIVRYSSLENFELPKFTLCSPGSIYNNGMLSNVVGMLTDHEAEEIVFNFNATSELNMRVNRVIRENEEDNAYTYSIYRSLQNKRLIFAEDIGYFMISSVKDGYENGVHYKDISAKSIDVEIEKKMIPFIADGTYRFSTDDTGTNKGILETIIETIPLWTIGYVDNTVAEKWRTFEDVDTSLNCLSFLLDKVQEAYECIFIFNIVNRVVNVYAQDNYVRETNIHLTKSDLINSINITENADDLYTAISVLGDEDNVTISAINPLGTNVIYDFSYYIDWMTEGLAKKVTAWQGAINEQMDKYYKLNLQYYNRLSEAYDCQFELECLATQIKMYTRCRENIIAEANTLLVDDYNTIIIENGGKPIEVCTEIAETLSSIDELIAECESKQENVVSQLNAINVYIAIFKMDISKIQESLSIKTYFTEEEYAELSNYIFEGSYRDEYVTITDIMTYDEKFAQMKILYDRSKSQLDRVSKPTQEFDVDVENFIFSNKFQAWSEQLETGCLINVELDTNDIASLFLSNITINYDDRNLTMTFGNRFNKFDPKSLFEDVLGDISKSANTLNYIKEILYPIKSGEFNEMKEALQTSRTLTMNKALSSQDEEVTIDGSGYTGRRKLANGEFDPQQVKLTSKNLVFTDDSWESSKTAVGELDFGAGGTAYGINAEVIMGDMIIGNNIQILDKNGQDLFTVVDGKISSSIGDVNDKLTQIIQDNEKLTIRISSLEDSTEADKVKTSMGYTFNNDGLKIHRENHEMTNLIDHEGMQIMRGDEEVLDVSSEGIDALNLTARQYLMVGNNARFEDYSNENENEKNRTACFYIGG